MMLADAEPILLWAGAIGGMITTVGGAGVALWFVFRSKTIEVERTEEKNHIATQRERTEAEQEGRAHDIESLRSIIEDLRGDVKEGRKNYTELQKSVTARLNETTTAHHECEKKHAVIEERLRANLEYTESLEVRIKSLEIADGGANATSAGLRR